MSGSGAVSPALPVPVGAGSPRDASSSSSGSWRSGSSWRCWISRSWRLRSIRSRRGLSAGPDEIAWVQTAYLMAEIVMIPLAAFSFAGAFDALAVHRLRRALHAVEPVVRVRVEHPVDDSISRHSGFRGRRDEPHRVRDGLCDFQRQEARDDPGDPGRGFPRSRPPLGRRSADGSPSRQAGAGCSSSM